MGGYIGSPSYLLLPLSGGLDHLTVAAGESFDLDFVLSSEDGASHVSAIFQAYFDRPGLEYLSYSWASPFPTGVSYDSSFPVLSTLPATIDVDTLAGLRYEPNYADVELANATGGPDFTVGTLVTLTLHVPEDYPYHGAMIIASMPDSFVDGGGEEVPTLGGTFELTITPEPATLAMLLAGTVYLVHRRKR